MCEKFHSDRLRNDRSLGNGKSDNNKKKNNAWRSNSGLKIDVIIAVMSFFPVGIHKNQFRLGPSIMIAYDPLHWGVKNAPPMPSGFIGPLHERRERKGWGWKDWEERRKR